jgi:hypothetical protein
MLTGGARENLARRAILQRRKCPNFCVRDVFSLTHHWARRLYLTTDRSGKSFPRTAAINPAA